MLVMNLVPGFLARAGGFAQKVAAAFMIIIGFFVIFFTSRGEYFKSSLGEGGIAHADAPGCACNCSCTMGGEASGCGSGTAGTGCSG